MFELHDTVAVPEVDILDGDIEAQLRPAGGVSVSVIVPLKLFLAPSVMVELADWPAFVADGGLAVIVKSGGGGPMFWKVSRHPQPIGLLPHWSAP